MCLIYTDTASTDSRILLSNWQLSQYAEILIDHKGYDHTSDWHDLTMEDLMDGMGFKEGHAKRFMKYVDELNTDATQKDPRELLIKWSLEHHAQTLIDNGYDNISKWKELTMEQLTNDLKFTKVAAERFIKCVAELKL